MFKCSNSIVIAISILSAFLSQTRGDPICEITVNSTGIPLPALPDQFQATIEYNVNLANLVNATNEYSEYYDFTNNRGTVFTYDNLNLIRQYFLYDTNEMITVTGLAHGSDTDCRVQPLDDAEGTPFGNQLNITGHIVSPSIVLKMGYNYTTTFLGTGVVRGINVLQWTSCTLLVQNELVKVVWSFSDSSLWNSSIILNYTAVSVPVEITVERVGIDSGVRVFETYSYFKYRPYLEVDAEIFETPSGAYCPGRKPTVPVPKVADHFSFRMESTTTVLSGNITATQSEWYDFEHKLARIDYQPLGPEDIAVLGPNPISEIHDFSEGVRYIFDETTDRCINKTILDPYSVDTGIANSSTGYVRIRTALEMFHFDNVDYQYHGKKRVRSIDCDVWIALRIDWPPGQPRVSLWEWYFMSGNWSYENRKETSVPVQLIINSYFPINGSFISAKIYYNYFDYSETRPSLGTYGTSRCSSGAEVMHLMITFKNVDIKMITDMRNFKYQVFKKLNELTYVLPTRVDNIEIDSTDGNLEVSFKLLESSKIGNVDNPVKQISLKDAYSLLSKAVQNSEFLITSDDITYTAASDSLIEVTKYNSKDDSNGPFKNTLVIITIAVTAIICLVVGGLVSFLIMRKKRTSDHPSLSMSGLMNVNN